MPVFVKIPYQDDLAVVEAGAKAVVEQGKLKIFSSENELLGSFKEFDTWWVGKREKSAGDGQF